MNVLCLSIARGHPRPVSSIALLPLLAAFTCAAAPTATLPPPARRPVDFLKDIQPLLERNCYSCHGPDKQKADLRWDTKASVMKTGDHGPILVPGDSAASRVIKLVAGLD